MMIISSKSISLILVTSINSIKATICMSLKKNTKAIKIVLLSITSR